MRLHVAVHCFPSQFCPACIGHPERCVDDVVKICADSCKWIPGELASHDHARKAKGVRKGYSGHGCLLPKVRHVFAIKDDGGVLLALHENDWTVPLVRSIDVIIMLFKIAKLHEAVDFRVLSGKHPLPVVKDKSRHFQLLM